MELRDLVHQWFETWERGDFESIPVSDGFQHTSPFGTVDGKATYVAMVDANRDSFLGFTFEIHDQIYEEELACVRYTGVKGDYRLEVSEWFYPDGDLIGEIVSYYDRGA